MTILDEIVAWKKKESEPLTRKDLPLQKTTHDTRVPRGFKQTLANNKDLSFICEIKKASPSEGIIRQDFDPELIAQLYTQGGADCISVLTDIKYFQGAPEFLNLAKGQFPGPALRKDFIVRAEQIRESYDLGADCVLLIVSSLTDPELLQFREMAESFGMDVLVEVKDEQELRRAVESGATLIGVNNRDLATFKVDITMSHRLAKLFPSNVISVSESGIRNKEDCRLLRDCGFSAVLVGTSLMRAADPLKALNELKP